LVFARYFYCAPFALESALNPVGGVLAKPNAPKFTKAVKSHAITEKT